MSAETLSQIREMNTLILFQTQTLVNTGAKCRKMKQNWSFHFVNMSQSCRLYGCTSEEAQECMRVNFKHFGPNPLSTKFLGT